VYRIICEALTASRADLGRYGAWAPGPGARLLRVPIDVSWPAPVCLPGLAPSDSRLSRCAIVANDIPSFREIWGDAALYFETNDADSLADAIRRLNADRQMCRAYANLAYARARDRFTTKRMIDDYLELYRSLSSVDSAAA